MTARSSMDVSEIAHRGLPLFGRANESAGAAPEAADAVEDAVERRLARWRQTAAGGDALLFDQRLAKDGLDVAAARAVLAAPAGHADEVPGWMEILEAGAAGAAPGAGAVGIVDTDIQSPGIHVLFRVSEDEMGLTLNDYLWGKCGIAETAHDVTASWMPP